MTTGRDIAFWEILKDKVLHPRLVGLPARFTFSGSVLECPVPLLSYCFFFISMLAYSWVLSRASNLKKDHIPTRAALRALVTVIVPTCSLWPSRYIKLASTLPSRVRIPLEVIIKDTIDGVIELRDPNNDLVDLISSGATVNGHTIHITLGWKWWFRCCQRWIFAESKLDSSRSGLSNWLHHNMHHANTGPLNPSPSQFPLASSTLYPLFCLDYLPHGATPTLNAGCTAVLEFTAFSLSLRTISTAQILSAVPFLISGHPHHWPRPLVSVLKQLNTSYGPNITINSLSNVSVDYEHALRHVYQSLSGEQKIHGTGTQILDIKAWRLKMFLVALEAALVRRGWIERWAVQVTVW